MSFIDTIFSWVWDISDYFYNAYLEVRGWMWPFSNLQYPLYYLYWGFRSLLTPIAQLSSWASDINSKVANVLTWSTIWSYILSYVPNLTQMRDWFYGWWSNVWGAVGSWWLTVSPTVQGWIDIAKTSLQSLIANVQKELSQVHISFDNFWTITWPQWTKTIDTLSISFDNFWTITLPGLITDKAAGDLINSTLKTWFPFYDDLVELWGDIKLFFTNPLDWLKDRLEIWFWGGE